MGEDLRHLKESLDDTYFNELILSNTLKKKIIRKAVKQNSMSISSMSKFMASILAAAICLIIFTISLLQITGDQAEQTELSQQRIALLQLQEKIVKTMQKQNHAEAQLLNDIINKESSKQIEESRTRVLSLGDKVASMLEDLNIPTELSPYEEQIRLSLLTLAAGYRLKNDYYHNLATEDFTFSHLSFYSGQSYAMKIYQFESQIGEVYEEVDFLTPRFITLLSFEPFPNN